MSTALVWFRCDLRIADNPALRAALKDHDQVLPIYIDAGEDPNPWTPGGASRWWLHHSLTSLSASLAGLGAPLLIRQGEALPELRKIAEAVKAEAVYWNREYDPAGLARDREVKAALRDDGLAAESFNARQLFEPWALKTAVGEPYRVFTPYWRNAEKNLREDLERGRAPLPTPKALQTPPESLKGLSIERLHLLPKIKWDAGLAENWTPGEVGAWQRLESFCEDAAVHYREQRDFPAQPATSKLSPHLHFGEISPLQIATRIQRLIREERAHGLHANAEWFLRELGWREFNHQLLFHFPETPEKPLNPQFASFPWREARDYRADLKAWQRGQTGVPIVDAGMRELWHSGWMHNRVRMIVASFLTKNLLIPWQEGARWFWDTLVDADLANNTAGWQWTAGSGADAAPYFRIFNPVLQSQKFDAGGAYLHRWLPELAKLSGLALHAPWQAKAEILEAAGVRLGKSYPEPIVDLAESRERALAAYDSIKLAR